MPSSGAPDDTGQSDPNASGAPDSSRLRIRYCLSARSRPAAEWSAPSSAHPAAPTAAACSGSRPVGEPPEVGVVDQLRVRDHRPPVARSVALRRRTRSHPAPGARPHRRSRGCGSAARVRRPARAASARLPSQSCMPWLCSAAVRREQRPGLVLDDTVGEELHRLRGQQRRVDLVDAARASTKCSSWESKWRGSA